MAGYQWVDATTRTGVPPKAVSGGRDSDGSAIFIGKSFYNGDWLPAKIIPSRRQAYVAYNGKEQEVTNYKVLCQNQFNWVKSQRGVIPPNAVEGGVTKEGETLFIGRVSHRGSQTVGKVHPSHKTCYIAYGGSEVGYPDYEILVFN